MNTKTNELIVNEENIDETIEKMKQVSEILTSDEFLEKEEIEEIPEKKENITSIEIEVEYTDEEINEMAKSLNDLFGEKLSLESQKKNSADSFNSQIKRKENAMEEIHNKIVLGHFFKYIPCRLEYNYETNSKQYIDTTTNEVVKSEKITSEMQTLFEKPLEVDETPEP